MRHCQQLPVTRLRVPWFLFIIPNTIMAVDRFDEAGFCVVEQALSAEVVQAFVGQIEAELALEAGTVGTSQLQSSLTLSKLGLQS